MELPPLNPHVPIVDEKGRPTPVFHQWWQRQREVNTNIAPLGTGAEISALLDKIGGTQGDILYRDSANWNVLPAGITGRFLKTQGSGANPVWDIAAGSFIALTDTPTDYTGQAGKVAAVKADETGLEFVTGGGGGGGSFLSRAGWSPVTDATAWTSLGVVNPRTDPTTDMFEDNALGYLGWTYRGASTGPMRLESATKNPTAGADFDFVFRVDVYKGISFPEALGVYVRNSANDKVMTFVIFSGGQVYRQYWTGNVFSSETNIDRAHQQLNMFDGYLRFKRTGPNILLYTSMNGITWVLHETRPLAEHLIDVNRCGLFHRMVSGSYSSITLWGLNDDGPQPPGV